MLLMSITWIVYFVRQDKDFLFVFWQDFSETQTSSGYRLALASVAALLTALFILRKLKITAPQALAKPSPQELAAAAEIIKQSPGSLAHLSLLGDKYLCWNEDRSAFIMFETTASYWIALGDPIGNQAAIASIIWTFREQAHRFGAQAVFYQVSAAFLPYYLELGLSFYKLGESLG